MEIIKASDASRFKNSESCTAIEYVFADEKDINTSKIILNGRYPEVGYALNTISKELVYVAMGNGTLESDGVLVTLSPGDVALIQPHAKYYFEGEMELIISSSPAWDPDQHQYITE